MTSVFLTLSQYIKSVHDMDIDGTKDLKIKELLEYYQKYCDGQTSIQSAATAVIYARYSSHNQRDESIEGQIRDGLECALKNNMIVAGVYIDRAMTGRNDKRESFQQLMKDADRHKFGCLIAWKVDRIARNRYDAATYKARLKKNNVRIIYVKEEIPDGPIGILVESMLEGQAEYYSASLSENIRRGQEDNALECKSNGSIPLGYKIGKNRQYEIDPATAPIVQTIFDMYNSGYTYKEMENYLNKKGYTTSRGNPYHKNSFRGILSNERYVGIYKYRDVTIAGGMPQIIDKELFDAVQKRLDKNNKAKARKKSDVGYLLTTKIFCGKCGRGMVGESAKGRSKIYYYYTCIGRKRSKNCNMERISKDWIEDFVVEETIRHVLQNDMIQRIADEAMAYLAKEDDKSMLVVLKKKLSENKKAIQNLMAAIEQGIITESTKRRLEELEDERAQLEHGIAEENIKKPIINRNQFIFLASQFLDGDKNDPIYRQRLIDTFVNAVYIFEDKIIIAYNYSDGTDPMNLEKIERAIDKSIFEEDTNNGSYKCQLSPPNKNKTNHVFYTQTGFGIILKRI